MKTKQIIKQAHKLSGPLRIKNGGKCRLKDVDPGDTLELKDEDKPRAKEALASVCPTPRLLDALSCRDLGSNGTENRFKGLDSSNFGLELNFRPCSRPGRRSITKMEQSASGM